MKNNHEEKWYKKPWFSIYNSALFLCLGIWFFSQYALIHNAILGPANYQSVPVLIQDPLFLLMKNLEAYRVLGFLALLFAIWGAFCKPGKNLILCVPLGVVAILLVVITI